MHADMRTDQGTHWWHLQTMLKGQKFDFPTELQFFTSDFFSPSSLPGYQNRRVSLQYHDRIILSLRPDKYSIYVLSWFYFNYSYYLSTSEKKFYLKLIY